MTASDSDAVVRGAVGADDSAGRLGVTLLALSGRDTARVVVRLDGRR